MVNSNEMLVNHEAVNSTCKKIGNAGNIHLSISIFFFLFVEQLGCLFLELGQYLQEKE